MNFILKEKNSWFYYIIPVIVETNSSTKFILHAINPDNILDINITKFQVEKECGKSRMISCFSNEMSMRYLSCLYINTNNQLVVTMFNQYLEEEGKVFLSNITYSSQIENMFFKGITFNANISVIAYYTDYEGDTLIIIIKKIDYDEYFYPTLANYDNISDLFIEAAKFNKHYKLNDLVKLENNDIYFAASSYDRETLYIIILKIKESYIDRKYVTIELFKNYKHKFYNELRLLNYENSTVMGFSHCNYKKCEENIYHSTSLITFNEFKSEYEFDLIKSFYDSNYNKSEPIIIDFNIYKNNILGLKFKFITFLDIPYGINLTIPKNNSEVFTYIPYDFSSFKVGISLNSTGKFYLIYALTMDDSSSSNNLRLLISEEKIVTFTIAVDKIISNICDDKCSLCSSTDPTECISCKYDYSFIGDKKFCFNENGDMNISQIGDIYENIKGNMEEQNFMTIAKENVIIQLTTVDEQINNASKEISSVDLGECEDLLREQESIDSDEQFIMIKMDLKNNSISATYVQYEIYNPRTLKQISLQICEDIPIKIYSPVNLSDSKLSLISSLEESGYNAFDINDDFYNDICSTYTAENGADMVLSSRKSLIYDQNKEIYLCQSGCEFGSFNTKNGKAECKCKVQNQKTETDITKISFDKTEFIDSFL